MSSVKAVPLTCTGHSRPVTHLNFSDIITGASQVPATPLQYYLISACKDSVPLLRSGVTGDWVGSFLGHKGAISCVRTNSQATRALTSSADHTAKLWDATSGVLLADMPHECRVRCCEFVGETQVATATQTGDICIWETSGGVPTIVVQWQATPQPSFIKSLILVGDNQLLSASSDGTLRWWDLASNTVYQEVHCHANLVQCEQSAASDWLACCTPNKVLIYDKLTGDQVRYYDMDLQVSCAAVSPAKTMLAVGSSNDLSVLLYDFATGALTDTLKAHHGPVHSLKFSPDGAILASASEDGTIRLWKMTSELYGLWS